ncbi:hypothetical protein GUITHDRAFT_161065 [Guillardia theta CCMP2712]|uniref:Serine aminopeptidase S33 domain-containing protein n=2 Tax=Guillardia theta TaxID=55529 RepID=L1JYR1_GUITC|nr:hypothetical protein GUITHDRAFT_161065 [Guillardia theta CCMP2712]EKX53507.1 hypothetical protein GUITHDRAFT_161065 [Guillardia theta CCMP2712]|eukprot:XP_005840487.1 hypothetical protein GUITHDRAFT_161065 [Guillardia theta CCMP2712]
MAEMFAGLIYRPPRKEYKVADLGPNRYIVKGQMCTREDVDIVSRRNLVLRGSLYLPVVKETMKVTSPVPCVVYLHGNSGSRIDADDVVDSFLVEQMSVFTVDFGGCGLSDGDIVTLGWKECDDLKSVLDYLSSNRNISSIGLYGRSMGAATAMLVAADESYYHLISGMVLDSCYTSVRQVISELAYKYVGKIPLVPLESMIDDAVESLRVAVLSK